MENKALGGCASLAGWLRLTAIVDFREMTSQSPPLSGRRIRREDTIRRVHTQWPKEEPAAAEAARTFAGRHGIE